MYWVAGAKSVVASEDRRPSPFLFFWAPSTRLARGFLSLSHNDTKDFQLQLQNAKKLIFEAASGNTPMVKGLHTKTERMAMVEIML